MRFWFIIMTIASVACVPDAGELEAFQEMDYGVFASEVHPILERRCATPSCHGVRGRPLEIYAVGWHRLDPARVHDEGPLDDEELRLGYERARSFIVEAGTTGRCHLLDKPLAESAGGAAHEGGAQFEDVSEPDFIALHRWVSAAMEVHQ